MPQLLQSGNSRVYLIKNRASPVNPPKCCSLVYRGGLSSLDGDDASENDTSTLRDFVKGRWYAFWLAVTDNRIRGWIDGSR